MSGQRSLRDRLSRGVTTEEIRDAVRGKVVAITGSARGIGFETATQLFDAGATVALGDIDEEAVGKAAADLGVEGFVVDVTDAASFTGFLDAVEKALGPIDVLVNNAGIMPAGSLLDMDAKLIHRTLDINTVGVMLGTQLAARRMVPRGGGHIINIASVAGRLPTPGLAVYNGSKAAVIEFTEAADAELESTGVRVGTVMPTFARTGLIDGLRTNKLIRSVAPSQVAAEVVGMIVSPRVRVTAPRNLAWVHMTPMMTSRMKRATQRWSKLDRMFLDFDEADRADYDKRIGS